MVKHKHTRIGWMFCRRWPCDVELFLRREKMREQLRADLARIAAKYADEDEF